MIERLSSGNDRLDEILNGGLLKNSINLIVGVPGSGKTILSQQFAFHNATPEHRALYLSTLSEPLDKILRFGETLKVFDREAVRDGRVMYEDLGHVLGNAGLEEILATVERFLKELRPGIVVIDSFRAFHAVAPDVSAFRRFLYGLTRLLSASATTAVWNAPYTREQAREEAASLARLRRPGGKDGNHERGHRRAGAVERAQAGLVLRRHQERGQDEIWHASIERRECLIGGVRE